MRLATGTHGVVKRLFVCVSRITIGFTLLGLFILSSSAYAQRLPDFTSLVVEYSAAVVNISTTVVQDWPEPNSPEWLEAPHRSQDNPYDEYSRRRFGEDNTEDPYFESMGSGFVISPNGYVVTNKRVIQDADQIIVRFGDGREFEAELVGADEYSDIALLKIVAHHLPSAKLGSSDDLEVGEWVLAVGSPFGFDHSVTAGIVSATGRKLPREVYVPFIQTDVAINPGSWGGPLFNLSGEVIGVNSQIFSETGAFMGLSFAIPIDVVIDVTEQLKSRGHVFRGWLGVSIQDVTWAPSRSFGMARPRGALITGVLPDGPAEQAGLKVGDTVVAVNEQAVERWSDFRLTVGKTKVGTRATVNILRNGRSRTVDVMIDELPSKLALEQAYVEETEYVRDEALGLVVADLSYEQREHYKVWGHGVLVMEVEDGPGKRAGIRRGDVLLRLDDGQVDDAADFLHHAFHLPTGEIVSVLVLRDRYPMILALTTTK